MLPALVGLEVMALLKTKSFFCPKGMWPIACGLRQNNKWQVPQGSTRPMLTMQQFSLVKPQCPEE